LIGTLKNAGKKNLITK